MKSKFTIALFLITFFFKSFTNAQWEKTNGPEGITVTSFFNYETLVFCGTYAQGVYRSTDHGNSWIVSNIGLENNWIDCFESDSSYLYAGSMIDGVFRSSDNGLTWQPANTGIQDKAVFCLLKVGGNLFAGTVRDGIYLSTNQGNTWTPANGGAFSQAFIKAMVYQAPRLMVEADNYIIYTIDTGNTWFVDQGVTQFYQIYDFFQQGDTIFAAAFNNVFRTTDGGLNWSNPYQFPSTVVGFGRIGNTIYAGTAFGVHASNDWGVTWTQVPATGLRRGAVDFIISGNNFLLGRYEIGIAISADTGSSWTQLPLSQFARASAIDDAMIFANDTVYSGTHGNGVFATGDQGNTWNKIGTSNQFDTLSNEVVFSMLHIDPNILLAGGGWNGIFRSIDYGATWTHITAGLPQQGNPPSTNVQTLAQCGSNILAATTQGVYYSTDSGLTWIPTNLTGPNILGAGGFAVRGNIACVGIYAFTTTSQTGIYRSTDYGITWSMADPIIDNGFLAAGGNHTMYGGYLSSSYVSYDDGLTWGGIGLAAVFTVLAWDNYAFIGNHIGVYFSDDYGFTWSLMNQGMDPYPNNAVQGLTRDSMYVYAGTYRDAVWRRPLSEFGIVTGLALHSQAEQNPISVFPNPTNGKIILSFNNIDDNMEVKIYNSNGQEVRELFTERSSLIQFDMSGFPDGIYMVVQHLKDATYSQKFVLNKK